MAITAEVTFMVYGQNGVGKIEKRTMELSQQDFTACTGTNRNNNENLKRWAMNMFPTAKDVKIQTIKKKD